MCTNKLQELEIHNVEYYIPAICCQEVLQGAKNKKEFETLNDYLTTQLLLTSNEQLSTHLNAGRIYFDCRRKGLTIRSSVDCFISQLVIEHQGTLIHLDKDFEAIKKVRSLKTFTVKNKKSTDSSGMHDITP